MGSGTSTSRSSHMPPRGFVLDAPKGKGMLPVMGLHAVLLAYGRSATAALLAANVLSFFRPGPLDGILPKLRYAGFNPKLFLELGELKNVFLSCFYHVDEGHLFDNMTGLLLTGVLLEGSMGTAEFASMVAALLALSRGITLLLCQGLCLLGDDVSHYNYNCVGFSVVNFGLFTELACACSDNLRSGCWISRKFTPAKHAGILLKFAIWANLFLTQALHPEVHFLGHLGGLLAGFVYHRLKRYFKSKDPLTAFLISRGIRSMTLPATFALKLLTSVLLNKCHMAMTGRGRDDGRRREYPRGLWICSTCNCYNSIATDTCETCSTMREGCAFSQRQHIELGATF